MSHLPALLFSSLPPPFAVTHIFWGPVGCPCCKSGGGVKAIWGETETGWWKRRGEAEEDKNWIFGSATLFDVTVDADTSQKPFAATKFWTLWTACFHCCIVQMRHNQLRETEGRPKSAYSILSRKFSNALPSITLILQRTFSLSLSLSLFEWSKLYVRHLGYFRRVSPLKLSSFPAS